MSRLEQLGYEAKYTLGAYADRIMSLPIFAGEKIAGGIEKVLGDKTPESLTAQYTREHSALYKAREKLRDSLDTRPGSVYLGSNFIAAIPFFGIGIPTAEFAQVGIDRFMSGTSEIGQAITNSAITLASQMITGYSTFMVMEVISNRDKYVDESNHLMLGKIGKCLKNTVKAFLSFDLTYMGAKTLGQSYLLMQGKDPWIATSLFDSVAVPTFSALAVFLGLRGGLIETKKTKQDKLERAKK